MARINVKVVPGSDRFRVEKGMYPKIHLTSPAENGKANAELVDRLTGILGVKTGIVSGHKSRRKEIAADLPEDEMMEKLEAVIDG